MVNIILPYANIVRKCTICGHMVRHMVYILPYTCHFSKIYNMLTYGTINFTICHTYGKVDCTICNDLSFFVPYVNIWYKKELHMVSPRPQWFQWSIKCTK